MAQLGLPFRGSLWYWSETTYGDGGSGTTYAISCKVLDARPGINDKHKPLYGIDSPCACHLLEQAEDIVFHLEYIPQTDDTLIDLVVDRDEEGFLQPLAFCIGTNVNIAGTDKTYFHLKGCKPKTVRISSSFNNEYIVSVDFSVKSAVTSTSAVGSAPTALTGNFCAFNASGAIQKDDADVAYIVDGIDITFDHGLIDKWDHDTTTKQYCIEGQLAVSGSIDISLDEGGGVHWAEILNQDEFDIVVDLASTAGSPRITLPDCKWKSGEFDVNISSEPMMDSAPFTCHPGDSCTDGFISTVPA